MPGGVGAWMPPVCELVSKLKFQNDSLWLNSSLSGDQPSWLAIPLTIPLTAFGFLTPLTEIPLDLWKTTSVSNIAISLFVRLSYIISA